MNRFVKTVVRSLGISGLIFFVIHSFHFILFDINVVLYAAVFDAFISGIVSVLVLTLLEKKDRLSFIGFEKALIGILSFFLFSLYSLAIPTVVDRSVSIYILETIAKERRAYNFEEVKSLVRGKYIEEMKVIEQRLIEQKASGTIEIRNNSVFLTSKGELIAYLSQFYKDLFLKNINKESYDE